MAKRGKYGNVLPEEEALERRLRLKGERAQVQRRELRKLQIKQEPKRYLSRGFRLQRRVGGFLGGFAQQRRTQLLVAKQIRRPLVSSGIKTGKRGRPSGSYDPRYAKFGGVYGYRKVLNAQLRAQRLQNVRATAITPQQETILDQYQRNQVAMQTAPENQTIPDTTGKINLRSIHQEADDFANLFP